AIGEAYADGIGWLAEPEVVIPPPPPAPWWERWYVWVGVVAFLAAAITPLAVSLRPEPDQVLEVALDPMF
nr:hypothetical protein [Actinomycetota bacterium]NIU64352.1 hypothetical protein [Actinomycetota bacterium]